MPGVLRRPKIANGVSAKWIEDVAIPYAGDECLPWPFHRNQLGRPVLRVNRRSTYATRVVCERVHGPPPTPKHLAAHSCGRGHTGCMTPRHLHWATHQENSLEMIEHGNSTRGSTNPRSKLKEADVLEIRRLVAEGEMQKSIAQRYGVSRASVCLIVKGRTWAWLASA